VLVRLAHAAVRPGSAATEALFFLLRWAGR
jgi:hypothetical protein